MGPLLCLWIAVFIGLGQGCPESCNCVKKTYGRQLAECAYKDLQAVPVGLPSNVTTLTLSANRITALQQSSFLEVTQVTSLWLAHNEISAIDEGTFARLLHLKNIDLSHNQITDFPWGDLHNLSALQLLKMNNNHMAQLPREAFRTLKDLRSLWLNDNKFTTIAEGTLDAMSSLSQLQIYNNPFDCSCGLLWLKRWAENTLISIPEQDAIRCAAPDSLRGVALGRIPDLQCAPPSVQLAYHPNLDSAELHDGLVFMLHCSARGSPPPEISWKIQTSSQGMELNGPNVTRDGNDLSAGNSKQGTERFLLFHNGTLVIPNFSKREEGTYTCLATNEVGTRKVSISLALASSESPADDLLRNNLAASKLGAKNCYKEGQAKSSVAGEELVIIYRVPAKMGSSDAGALLEAQLWASVLCLAIFLYC
uniref:Immunoglobulin superfamily containing leucine rich repeat n=1 Tax=Pelusios castaneus TaxID=367368 RepID=A0A8C8RLA0_9SAUR